MKRIIAVIVALMSIVAISTGGFYYYRYTKNKNQALTVSQFNTMIADVFSQGHRTAKSQEDPQQKKERLRKKAETGDDDDVITYFTLITQGAFGEKIDWEELYQLILKAHESGSAKATWYLYDLMTLQGSEKANFNPYFNLDKARKYLEKAAQMGFPLGRSNLVLDYRHGNTQLGIERDLVKSEVWSILWVFNGKPDVKINSSYYTRKEFIDESLKKLPTEEHHRFLDLLEEYERLYTIK